MANEIKKFMNRHLVLVFLVLAFFLFGMYKIFFCGYFGQNLTPGKTPLVSRSPSLEFGKTTILSNSRITFPSVRTSTATAPSNLPQELSFLIPNDIAGLFVSRIKFVNNKNGFEISFQKNQSLASMHSQLISAFDGKTWKKLAIVRTDNFALIEEESNSFSARITLESLNAGQTKALVRIIEK